MAHTAAHTITVTTGFLGEYFVATCACGWASTEQDTRLQAMGAGDRHIALKIYS